MLAKPSLPDSIFWIMLILEVYILWPLNPNIRERFLEFLAYINENINRFAGTWWRGIPSLTVYAPFLLYSPPACPRRGTLNAQSRNRPCFG
jgi:hypothetical protein